MNGVLLKSTLVVILWFGRTSARKVHGIWKNDIPRTSRTNAKVTNNLRNEQNYQHEASRVNLGFKNPGTGYLVTKWHHGMLSRIMTRIITLGIQSIARLLSGPL